MEVMNDEIKRHTFNKKAKNKKLTIKKKNESWFCDGCVAPAAYAAEFPFFI
jgi:hypothetical protein